MAITINGTTGISGVDGSASTPALQGSDSNTGVSFGTDTVNINTGGSTKATVKSDGCLAIGTTQSAGLLNVEGTSYFGSEANVKVYAFTSSSEGRIGVGGVTSVINNVPLTFYTADGGSNNERMRIDHNGHIALSPNGVDPSSTGGITVRQSSPTSYGPVMSFNTIPANQGFTEFRSSGTQIGSIGKSGTTGVSYYSASDYRLKENESLIIDGITRLKILKPYRFNWKADASTKVDGFFAHEVTPAVPEAITGEKDAVDSNNDPIIQQIDQSKLIPLLTAALQEAVAKIEVLETKVAALEAA
tara:strand:- start:2186 stop:3091 length:906 start_codon:yes stop_codon:yes gene_type:complete